VKSNFSAPSGENLSRVSILRDRAALFQAVRTFFAERGVIETDCPVISASASVDAHIDLIPAIDVQGAHRFLHSSPEYGMKRLLAEGMGDIYQLAHVFRQGEYGYKHNPEFMMAEWYRLEFSFEKMIEETFDFIRLFLGSLPGNTISYREAILKHTGIDYVTATTAELVAFLKEDLYEGAAQEGKDALLNILLPIYVEPHLGEGELTALAYYPATQAALAKTRTIEGASVAERFEVYYKGVELANGYHELADAKEQRQRLHEANQERQRLGKPVLPIDENFLQALEKGLPPCCGVAVGVDRLMMLRHGATSLKEVIPFDWQTA